MRTPRFISPSALAKWQYNQEEYYLQYLADNSPPRMPQTEPMSVGSAFDAYVKSYMFERLFGMGKVRGSQFELETILTTQVEGQNLAFARSAGAVCFEAYRKSGALADLLIELEAARGEPRFEFTVEREVGLCGLKLLGKPDVWYVNRENVPIILDFKVNGYCSSYPTSPKRGYVRLRGAGVEKSGSGAHKKAQLGIVNGVTINIAEFLEDIDSTWAQQTTTYAWLCGANIGDYFIVAIDQLCCNGPQSIRVAEHRSQVGPPFQARTLTAYETLWEIIHSDHIFRDRSLSESQSRCAILDMQYAAYSGESGGSFIRNLGRNLGKDN
jgi:hypothetical protein